MTIKLLFFSLLQDVTQVAEREFVLQGDTVADLLQQLYAEYPKLEDWKESLLISINCEYARHNDKIPEGAEVALMPPVQGG